MTEPLLTDAYHRKAMDLVDLAQLNARGEYYGPEATDVLWLRALEHERIAAEALPLTLASEPSRSVLFRSASCLAIRCNDYREAERLACQGLLGWPPADIAEELRECLRAAWEGMAG